ncbi:hypothetical protein [Spartinivicinus ruber]|uniref:hypothetical protein n=1 Tax=Spartinivicinus ruber TaxID=2683272 RepID=UPI0013D6534E|nr:hypothetical protein [Spartinivicinus ruber]
MKERPVLEASLETSEALIDALTSNEVLSNIPFVGTAFKIFKAAESVRDKAFAMKLERFANPLSELSDDERQRFLEKLQQNQEEAKKVGETLFLVIDRLADVDKPEILGLVFIAYLNESFPYSDLRLMSQAIDMSYAEDLGLLVNSESEPEQSKEDWMQRLASAGLTKSIGGKAWNDSGEIYYQVTPLGNMLRNAYREVKQRIG